MAAESSKAVPYGFFVNHDSLDAGERARKEPVFVDMGGTGDCGFRSVAAGFIDNYITHKSVFRADLLKQVLEAHFKIFPKHRIEIPGLVKPADRMDQLIKTLSMGELVKSLAYTMRQMAVRELCAQPGLYRGAFVRGHEHTSPEWMRKPNTWIDESSIAALAHVLDMPIEVYVADRENALNMRLHYNPDSNHLGVVMMLRGGHYIPRVSASDRFHLVKSQSTHVLAAVNEQTVNDPSLSEILVLIEEDNQKLVRVFDDMYKNLAFKVQAGELNQDDLMDMYIKGIADSDYLTGRVKYVGIEQGNQDFFKAILDRQNGTKQHALLNGSRDSHLTHELIHALARAVSIGQMSAEQLFSQMDEAQDTGVSLR